MISNNNQEIVLWRNLGAGSEEIERRQHYFEHGDDISEIFLLYSKVNITLIGLESLLC
jgi:hypothetical protein